MDDWDQDYGYGDGFDYPYVSPQTYDEPSSAIRMDGYNFAQRNPQTYNDRSGTIRIGDYDLTPNKEFEAALKEARNNPNQSLDLNYSDYGNGYVPPSRFYTDPKQYYPQQYQLKRYVSETPVTQPNTIGGRSFAEHDMLSGYTAAASPSFRTQASTPGYAMPNTGVMQTFRQNTSPEVYANSRSGLTNNANAPTYFLDRLKALVENPSQVTSSPAYQFLMDQGMNALNRTAAAKRMRFAGKTQLDAQKYGQGLAAQEYGKLYNQLLQGAQSEVGRWGDENRIGLANLGFNTGRSDSSLSDLGYAEVVRNPRRLMDRYV